MFGEEVWVGLTGALLCARDLRLSIHSPPGEVRLARGRAASLEASVPTRLVIPRLVQSDNHVAGRKKVRLGTLGSLRVNRGSCKKRKSKWNIETAEAAALNSTISATHGIVPIVCRGPTALAFL